MSALINELVKNIWQHPIFALIIAVVLVAFIGYSYNTYATIQYVALVEQGVEENKKQVSNLSSTIKRSALESKIHSLESEIFGLERLASADEARDMDYDRLAKLKSELGTAKRDLVFIKSDS